MNIDEIHASELDLSTLDRYAANLLDAWARSAPVTEVGPVMQRLGWTLNYRTGSYTHDSLMAAASMAEAFLERGLGPRSEGISQLFAVQAGVVLRHLRRESKWLPLLDQALAQG